MKFWKERISYFLVKHPIFENSEEDIFTPREGMQIRFWFEGNLQIKGTHKDLQINYNDPSLLILATESNIYRIPWKRLICFEIITDNETNKEILDLVNIKTFHKN